MQYFSLVTNSKNPRVTQNQLVKKFCDGDDMSVSLANHVTNCGKENRVQASNHFMECGQVGMFISDLSQISSSLWPSTTTDEFRSYHELRERECIVESVTDTT